MIPVFLGLGSNLGDSRAILRRCWQRLAEEPDIVSGPLSSPYETAPVDMVSTSWFINCVGQIRTRLSPHALLERLLAIETEFGRKRSRKREYQDRTLDIDLLLYGDQILRTPELVIPHPRLHERLFVLVPLCELAPEIHHPVLGLPLARLRDQLLDQRKSQPIRVSTWA